MLPHHNIAMIKIKLSFFMILRLPERLQAALRQMNQFYRFTEKLLNIKRKQTEHLRSI
jgi:hypothetical protein